MCHGLTSPTVYHRCIRRLAVEGRLTYRTKKGDDDYFPAKLSCVEPSGLYETGVFVESDVVVKVY